MENGIKRTGEVEMTALIISIIALAVSVLNLIRVISRR